MDARGGSGRSWAYGNDFASLLERAIERSGKSREMKVIEHRQREGETTQ
jgi:ABC-type phosphate transport system auxiliary subunit